VFERQSALSGAPASAACGPMVDRPGLRIAEVVGWDLVQIAAFPATLHEFESAVRAILGADLPTAIGESVNVGGRCQLKTGPEQFWVMTERPEKIAHSLQAAIAPHVGSVTSLSHSRTCISVDGSAARELLGRGIAYDLHPDVFGVGRFTLTGLHHTPVLIHRKSADGYELLALRTYARSIRSWIGDAARSIGFQGAVSRGPGR
jgi:heterotetrameric sarcosine oxidase gamma subunit